MEEVTVVIPNYNGIRFLRECLESVLDQEEGTPGYKVVVVDNGSGDGSPELVRKEFPQVALIALDFNTGFCNAVNAGIEEAQTPYVILLNNDTKSDCGFVRGLYDAIKARPDAFSVSASMRMWDRPDLLDDAGDRYCVLGWAGARGKGKPAADYERPAEIFFACGGAAIYRRNIFDEIGVFDPAHFAYLEDLDIGYRALVQGWRNYYEPSAKVVHYGSATSGSRYNKWKTELAASNSVYVVIKNMPFLQLLWNFPFLLMGYFVKFLFFCRKRLGLVYLKGLGKGLGKSFSREGRSKKVPFQIANLRHYFYIQLQLYANAVRFLKKT